MWRSIDTLPDGGGPVLATSNGGVFWGCWRHGIRQGHWEFYDDRLFRLALAGPGPTHWMPLPEPPK